MKANIRNKLVFIILFSIFFLVGIFTFQDYGVGIEEHFQRKSGFYWLNFILNFTGFENLEFEAFTKLEEIKKFTPNLFPIETFGYYGVLFDLPMAFVEVLFNINEPKNYFYLRHISVFVIFLISGFCFYNLILNRFKSSGLAIFGFLVYMLSPRIYGNSFFDGKDLFFLSLITINIFFYFKYINKDSFINLIIFSALCAFATSTRIIGLLIPLTFLILIFFDSLSKNKFSKNIKISLTFILAYFIFLFIHWPYLWTLNVSEWVNFFEPFFTIMNPTVFFNGNYYYSKYLPSYYLPLWITITTPVIYLILFSNGFYLHFKRFFKRLININDEIKSYSNDLWRGNDEKKDFFVLVNLLLVVILYFSISPALLSGWRHFYFLNFFIVYYSCYSAFLIFYRIRNNYKIKIFSIIVVIMFFSEIVTKMYLYHPFQSSYFNNLAFDDYKKNFEVDTQSLSRADAIKEILKDGNNKEKIIIGTASWTPLQDARSLIKMDLWDQLAFSGTSNKEEADYIYTNYYYEINNKINKKYEIPKNFYLYKSLIIDGTTIYSIYKK